MGTSLVTGSGAPTAALVYKLIARADTDGPGRAAAADGQALGGQARPGPAQVGDAPPATTTARALTELISR